jgi:plastocyanin
MGATRTLGIVAALACAVVLASCAESEGTPERPAAKTHTVIMEGMAFRPKVITVAAGDTIVWVNRDLVPHTATSEAGGFDSKTIQADESWTHTAATNGDFTYVCTFHPAMTATLRVR